MRSATTDQPGHPPGLIRVFAVRMKKAWVLSYSEDWSDWADAQADQSRRWAHSHFVGFVMRRLNFRPHMMLHAKVVSGTSHSKHHHYLNVIQCYYYRSTAVFCKMWNHLLLSVRLSRRTWNCRQNIDNTHHHQSQNIYKRTKTIQKCRKQIN